MDDQGQIFLARVAAGRVFDVHTTEPPPGTPVVPLAHHIPDGEEYEHLKGLPAWKLPAPISSQGPAAFLKHPPTSFHSIRGNVGGPMMAYTVYEPKASYPAYLITFERD